MDRARVSTCRQRNQGAKHSRVGRPGEHWQRGVRCRQVLTLRAGAAQGAARRCNASPGGQPGRRALLSALGNPGAGSIHCVRGSKEV